MNENNLEEEEICEEIESEANSIDRECEVVLQPKDHPRVMTHVMPSILESELLANEHSVVKALDCGQCDVVTAVLKIESHCGVPRIALAHEGY